jgi:hypothetical protein
MGVVNFFAASRIGIRCSDVDNATVIPQNAALKSAIVSALGSASSRHLQQSLKRVPGKLCGMSGGRRQTSDRAHDVILADRTSLRYRLSLSQLGHRRSAGHGGYTTFGAKPDLANPATLDLGRQLDNIAAGRILHLYVNVCPRQLARIARVFEVVKKFRRIHGR